MDEHVFGKFEAGDVDEPKSGGLTLYEGEWLWFRANRAQEYSTDSYGLQEESDE